MPSRLRLLALTLALLALGGGLSFALHRAAALGRSAAVVAPTAARKAAPAAVAPAAPLAATIVVTSTADDTLANLALNTTCDLREAIEAANTNAMVGQCVAGVAGADTITFAPGVTGTITLTAGELALNEAVTIEGPGATVLAVSGNNASRVFFVNSGVTASLSGLTITGGNGVGAALSGDGGGILNRGNLTITASHLTGNTGTFGGGIRSNSGTLTVERSAITGNTATGNAAGGGIDSSGTLIVTNTTVSGNRATGAGGRNGGGIWSGGGSTATITASTITDNEAAGGNSAGGVLAFSETVTVRNTIIAANRNNTTTPDVNVLVGTFDSDGYNLIGNPGAVTAFNQTGDQVGTMALPLNPVLGPLANNGGTTPTHRPLPGSTTIDKGNSFGLTTDQRGVTRPQNDSAIAPAMGGDNSDIGAVELTAFASTSTITLTIDPAMNPSGAVAELIDAINAANANPDATTINLVCGTYTLTGRNNTYYGFTGLPVITSPVMIEGNGAVIERSNTAPSFRLFAVAQQDPQTGLALATPGSLTLRQVTLRGGLAQGGAGGAASLGAGGGGAGLGGAVYNQGTLTVEQSAIIANTAQGGRGGDGNLGGSGQRGGGGGLGGNGGTSTYDTQGGGGGGGFGGDGGLGAPNSGAPDGRGGGEGGGRTANGNNGSGNTGGSGGSAEGGDGANAGFPGNHGGFGGGGGGGGDGNGNVGSGGIGGGGGGKGGGGGIDNGGNGGFGGGGGGRRLSGGSGGFGGGGGGGGSTGGNGGFGGGDGSLGGGGGAGLGGAIFNDGGALILTNSTLSGNTASGGAGGTSNIVGQAGQGLGGGVFARNGSVTINNVTINNNTVTQGTGNAPTSAPAPQGGSLYLLGDAAVVYNDGAQTVVRPGDSMAITFTVSNSIFANTPGGASDAFVNTINSGTATPSTNNNNLVEVNGSNPTMADLNDLPGVTKTADPMLGALTAPTCAGGGCKTPVHPITATSPAFNVAGNGALTVDQCGTMRPQGGVADIGSYELVVPPVTLYTHMLADPLGCTGPDSLVSGTITLGNPAAFDQAFTLNVTFTNLSGVAGSCTVTGAAPGETCAVTAMGLTASGTLPANATLVVTYAARVQNVPVGTTISAGSSATLSGANVPPDPLTAEALVNCPLANLKNPPAAAAVSDQKPGSGLVFPYYTSDATGNFAESDTLITITNVSDGPATGADGAPDYQFLHLFFINANCSPADTFVCLTPNGSLQFRASEYDPLTTGYLVAVAVDAQGLPTANNNFIGAAFVRDDVRGVIDSYGAEAFAKLSAGSLAAGAGGAVTLYFDGADYEAAPIQLATPVQDPNRAEQTLVIASLRGDLGAKLDATGQSGAGALYRDDEVPASFQPSLGAACFIQRAVTNQNFRVVPGPLTSFLKDRSGYVKFNLTTPGVGLILSRQGAVGAGQNRFAGIHALHKTAVTASSLRLQVFPPFCN